MLSNAAPPSIHLWYALDIANRPEDAPAMIALRERVVYADTVQALFAAQKPEGYWDNPASVIEPRYRATVWNLALLAELGIPRASRRARMAIEFVLENNLPESRRGLSGKFIMPLAHFLRAAIYFGYASDDRIRKFENYFPPLDSFERARAWLWAFAPRRGELSERAQAASIVLDHLAQHDSSIPITFPHFETFDDLFALRVLAEHRRANDPRAEKALMRLVAKQDEQARWRVEKNLSSTLTAPIPDAPDASYWITLNALRVIKSIVMA